jgi:hypothetical protein
MVDKSRSKRALKTPVLALAGFWLGILALIPMSIMTVDFIIPPAFASAMRAMPLGLQNVLLFYYMLGSLPFAISALVVGIIALRRIKKDKFLKGVNWAVLAIIFGCLGLVFGVFLYLHFVSVLQPTPALPI